MASVISEWVHLDGRKVTDKVIGVGVSFIVLEQGEYAVKIPRISRMIECEGKPVESGKLTPEEGGHDIRPDLIRALETEKAIYRRLGDHPGIMRCYNLSSAEPSLQMVRMKSSLRRYLATNNPGRDTRLSWAMTMADTIAYIHSQRVIICDIHSQNILLNDDDELALQFIDFSDSSLMPLDWNLEGPDNLGYSILTDLGKFGTVLFEVATGQICRFDSSQGWEQPGDPLKWPSRDSLPSTEGIWLGEIIEKCWTQGYLSCGDLAADLLELHRGS